jgi:pyruvate formate lyase activating enzyme
MIEGTIFSIRESVAHKGPGLRTAVYFKGCPLRCVWCPHPEGISFEPQYVEDGLGKSLCGCRMRSEELAAAILKNKEDLVKNKGGVTATGGEPLAQPEFLFDLLPRLKPLHTVIETNGYASPEIFRQAVGLTDLVLFNLKLMNPEWHQKFTGVRNLQILENLSWLCSGNKPFILRIPLVPGITDSQRNMFNILAYIRHPRSLVRIDFLPFQKESMARYAMIGKTFRPPFDPDMQPEINDIFSEYCIKTQVI